ncbi:hypothetical protein NL676_022966 [Syzygium grande]|nr:hypothetical protein NL676_022966 [Syzygium grande]
MNQGRKADDLGAAAAPRPHPPAGGEGAHAPKIAWPGAVGTDGPDRAGRRKGIPGDGDRAVGFFEILLRRPPDADGRKPPLRIDSPDRPTRNPRPTRRALAWRPRALVSEMI